MSIEIHSLTVRDANAMDDLRALLQGEKGLAADPDDRRRFDDRMSSVPPVSGVTSEADSVGGVPGWWVHPPIGSPDQVMLYLHGGDFVAGSARAYRNLVGQIASRSGVSAFVADYALAPERPFPGALDDARRAYEGLLERGFRGVALVGDSAGGGLALSLLAQLDDADVAPACVVVVSAWTDLCLSGHSIRSKADVDPIASATALDAAARLYLGGHDPRDPAASPLYANRGTLPPMQMHVGAAEVLLDDTLRFAERAGDRVEAHVWEGMVHLFPANVGSLDAAGRALDNIGAFIATYLNA